MFVNKEMFSIQSSPNFAHADQMAPLEMAVRHVNTWIRLRVSAESSWSLFSFMFYEGISKSFEPNMERARNLDLFCFIFQRSPLPTPHTCPI